MFDIPKCPTNSRFFFSKSQKIKENQYQYSRLVLEVNWLVGCFGFNGPLRQYFSLYRAVEVT